VVAYDELNTVECIKQFAYDVHEGIILIMYMIQSGHSKKRYMKIIELATQEILFNSPITDPDLIGRLKCGIFTLVNGHLYYDNRVIKIRYDLLRLKKVNAFDEDEAFDYYYKILDLNKEQKEEVQIFFP
jgi:hypothetical protein